MHVPQSDEKITQLLNTNLTPVLFKNHKCISNSMILPSQQGAHQTYFAKNQKEEFVFIAINISIDQKQDSIKIFSVKIDSSIPLDHMVLDFTQCPYMPDAFAVLAYDPREKSLGKQKLVFLTSISIDTLTKKPLVEFTKIASKYSGTIKDVKWYPFAAMTLLILTDTRFLVFKIDQDPYEPSFQINIKELQVVNASEVTRKDQFQKIGFAQNLNQEGNYSSLGKKLSLYLVSNTGAIYLLFPFVSYQVILDDFEAKILDELRKLPVSTRRQERANKMAKIFQESKLRLVSGEGGQESRGKEYELVTKWPSKIKPEIFKLNPVAYNNSSSNNVSNSCQRVEIFKPVTLGSHTLFLTGTKLKNKQYDFRVMVFSEEPYGILLGKGTFSKTENYNIETVGQIKLDQTTDDEKFIYGNSLQLTIPTTLDNTQLYLTHNNMSCYRILLFGLERFLKNQEEENQSRLVEVDILFDSKHKLLTLSANDTSVFVLRNSNETYLFESIPIKSLELKEKINKTIQETQELFKKLASKPKSLAFESKPQQNVEIKKIESAPLVEIQEKLKTFSQDYRKSVQNKLQKIKKLYEHIQSKNQELRKQQNQKTEMIKLVNQAEDNEKTIKQMFTNEKKNFTNKTEVNIRRRIQAASKLLDEIRSRIESESKEIKSDTDKMELMEDCEGQADGVINKLQDMKQQLIAKKNQLRKELGF